MTVEFALRPRIRLREDPSPPRRSRLRVPRWALPIAAYWLAAAGISYAFVHSHDAAAPRVAADEPAQAPLPASRPERSWWQPTPAPRTTAAHEPTSAPAVTSEPAPAPSPKHRSHWASSPGLEVAVDEPHQDDARVVRAEPEPRAAHDGPLVSGGSLPSCEAAVASAHQDVDFAQGNGTADLPTQAIAAVLENGAWLGSCNVPASTAVDVCVAIQGGAVSGTTVSSRPSDPALNACIRRRAAALQFPYNSHLDLARTRF